jgi:hypothetical protein
VAACPPIALPHRTPIEAIASFRSAAIHFHRAEQQICHGRHRKAYLHLRAVPALVRFIPPPGFYGFEPGDYATAAAKVVDLCAAGDFLEARELCLKSANGLDAFAEFIHAELAALQTPQTVN